MIVVDPVNAKLSEFYSSVEDQFRLDGFTGGPYRPDDEPAPTGHLDIHRRGGPADLSLDRPVR